MAKNQSAHYKERTGASSGEEPLYLLEISHAQLADPIRVVRDTVNLESNGETFTACWFDLIWPDDVAGSMPRAPVQIDNVGKELTDWLDASDGGRGASVRLMAVMRDTPDVIEEEYTLDLLNVRQGHDKITGELGYENVLNQPGLPETYRPENTPGLF